MDVRVRVKVKPEITNKRVVPTCWGTVNVHGVRSGTSGQRFMKDQIAQDTESPSALAPSEMESSDEFWTERQTCFPRIRVGCIVKKSQVSIREGSREPVDEMGELV